MDKRPLFLKHNNTNGRVREDHAPKSVLFRPCWNEKTEEGNPIEREFQLSSIDVSRGVSVYRCVICNYKIELNSAQAEGEK